MFIYIFLLELIIIFPPASLQGLRLNLLLLKIFKNAGSSGFCVDAFAIAASARPFRSVVTPQKDTAFWGGPLTLPGVYRTSVKDVFRAKRTTIVRCVLWYPSALLPPSRTRQMPTYNSLEILAFTHRNPRRVKMLFMGEDF
ncbi:MAG: hypothetical protein M0Z61_09640 [Nitrospiraceae bacterium]|nr:hypothetical protein [Nitrospiraceae bacterium]